MNKNVKPLKRVFFTKKNVLTMMVDMGGATVGGGLREYVGYNISPGEQ